MKPTILIMSCEHASNIIPEEYQHLFLDDLPVLASHRTWDKSAQEITSYLSQLFECDYVLTRISHLIIDCNRSLAHNDCFSAYSRHLSEKDKQHLIDEFYLPYRQHVEKLIRKQIDNGNQVLHLSIHSFIPELNGKVRNAAIGLLYDSSRHGEQEVARLWCGLLSAQKPAYRVRKNYPYRSHSNGLISSLRRKFCEEDYLGLEIECNQAITENTESLTQLQHMLAHTLDELLQLL
ncbi:MAG: N-formylglutamate amidohydrolase [Legionella sp.]